VPFPRLAQPDIAAFDALLEQTPDGGLVDYRLAQPKWWFLHHQIARGYLLHGTNEAEIAEFRVNAQDDAHGVPIEAVFASDDAIWPIYFAVVNRPVAQSYINWCEHVGGASRYLFSIGSDPRAASSWTTGTVYLLPRETFRATPNSRELVSDSPVRPRARLTVSPDDFPFRRKTRGHRRGDSVRKVALLHALRWPSPRRPPESDSSQTRV
jgi:hypothetical protein